MFCDVPKKSSPPPGMGTRIKVLREARGLSQDDLAAAAEVSRQTIGKIESGKADTGAASLMAIARKLEVRLDDLAFGGHVSQATTAAIQRFAKSIEAGKVNPTPTELALLASLPTAAWGGREDPTPGSLVFLILAMRG